MPRQISLRTIRDAAPVVYGVAIRTPTVRLEVPGLGGDGPEIFLKLETLQPIGSFKIRGAQNAVGRLPRERLAAGVWTVSAGNAAQGVAFAARRAGVPCSVMVMDTAPDTKIQAITALGASIVRVTYDEAWRTVESHRSDRMRGHFVHPFDDDAFIAGNTMNQKAHPANAIDPPLAPRRDVIVNKTGSTLGFGAYVVDPE